MASQSRGPIAAGLIAKEVAQPAWIATKQTTTQKCPFPQLQNVSKVRDEMTGNLLRKMTSDDDIVASMPDLAGQGQHTATVWHLAKEGAAAHFFAVDADVKAAACLQMSPLRKYVLLTHFQGLQTHQPLDLSHGVKIRMHRRREVPALWKLKCLRNASLSRG